MEEPSEPFSGTWPKAAGLRNGVFYLRPTSARPTEGSGCLSWPTIRLGGGNRNSRQALTNAKGHPKGKSDFGLEQAIEVFSGELPKELETPEELPPQWAAMWPTPDANEGNGGRRAREGCSPTGQLDGKKVSVNLQAAVDLMWATPCAAEAVGRTQSQEALEMGFQETLCGQAKLWATPSAQEPGILPERIVDRDGNTTENWNQRLYDRETGRLVQDGLTQQVSLWATWATPGATDHKGSTAPGCRRGPLSEQTECPSSPPAPATPAGPTSSATAPGSPPLSARKRLNPDFVDWLMGVIPGWTQIAYTVSARQGMEWFLCNRLTLSVFCGDD